MTIDTKLITQLREMTGAGIVDVKKALEEANGDIDKAAEELRKKGIVKAAKKSDREAKEGLVYAYIHGGGKVGVLVEINCETDFVARNEKFSELCHDIAMHIAAMSPEYISPEDVPAAVLDKEMEIEREALKNEGKPEDIIAKILEGKKEKFYDEVCLMRQSYIKDDKKTIEDVLKESVASLGENMQINRFSRFEIAGSGTACGL